MLGVTLRRPEGFPRSLSGSPAFDLGIFSAVKKLRDYVMNSAYI
jgi:hypothetical protein